MDIHYHLSQNDVVAGRKYVKDRMRERGERLGFWSALALGLLGGLLWQMFDHPEAEWAWVMFVLVFCWLSAWELYALRIGHHVHWLGNREGDYALELDRIGLSLRLPDGQTVFHTWREVSALETTADYLYFYLRPGAAFAVPCAPLERDTVQAISSEVRALWAAAPGNMSQSLPAAPGVPESPSYRAWANLRESVRLALFLPFDLRAFRPGWGGLSINLLGLAFMMSALSYLQALPLPLFNVSGIAPFLASLLLVAAWAAAVGLLLAPREHLLRMLTMTVAAMLFITMVAFFAYQTWLHYVGLSPRLHPAWSALVALWVMAVLARIVRALYARSAVYSVALASTYVFLTLGLGALAPQGTLYLSAADVGPLQPSSSPSHAGVGDKGGVLPHVPATRPGSDGQGTDGQGTGGQDGDTQDGDEGDAGYPEDALDVEDVYYAQPGLVQKALAGIRPHKKGETGLYFVGFAGDAGEHEFYNEVRYARGLLDRRFNTGGRSLMLVNSYDTVKDTPLANSHNLEAVLKGLGRRMDRKHDVLFLFLSSHGARDHWLEVSFDPLEMDDLRAEKLKAMLDKSGIRNRVIVVSACYAGGFLDVLKDDHTLVLTASSRDHVAYGCGDSTEYTNFGEAYFVNALEHGDSFIGAFGEARANIVAREHNEGVDPSDPQISVGRYIAGVLRKLKVVPPAQVSEKGGQGTTVGGGGAPEQTPAQSAVQAPPQASAAQPVPCPAGGCR